MDLRKSPWVAGGLLGVGLLLVVRGLIAPTHPAAARPSRPAPEVPPPTASAVPRPSSQSADWGINPFLVERGSAPRGAATPGGRVLSGILWDADSPSAIVDNRVVRVGDRLGGWRVQEIRQDRVVLSDGETTETLTLPAASPRTQ